MEEIIKNQPFNKTKWKIVKKIGQGGNGTVYEVKNDLDEHFAKKTLNAVVNGKPYKRFKQEIEVLTQLKGQTGIVQIVDHFFPAHFTSRSAPWYVMPLGQNFSDYTKGTTNEQFFELVFNLSETLVMLHDLDITHRDIKPDNLLMVDWHPVFSDFGLANFPKKERISAFREKIGAKWTIAPEMKRISSAAEFKRADVYSFAKTLWILITKQWTGFEGQYIPRSSISVDKYVKVVINEMRSAGRWNYTSIVLLDQLFADATSNDPMQRPTAKEFTNRLRYWYTSCDDYHERNPFEWVDALKQIFPITVLLTAKWTDTESILKVLKVICTQYDNLNHTFFPEHGGMDFESVDYTPEPGCLIINFDTVVKPSALIFEFMNDYNWSFFRLELSPLQPLTSTKVGKSYEDLFIDEHGDYVSPTGKVAHQVTRWLKGSFLIAKKTSLINNLIGELDGYSGIHNKVTHNEYKELLSIAKKQRNGRRDVE